MTDLDAPAVRAARFPLGLKVGLAIAGGAALLLAFLLVHLGPRSRQAFLDSADVLIAKSTDAMREISREGTANSRHVLVDLIGHTADARRRMLIDLPVSLYRGDPERIRNAIQERDADRARRLQANVDVLGREMQRRADARIDASLARLAADQNELGAGFADELRGDYVALVGGVFAVLLAMLGFGTWRFVVRPVRDLRRATHAVAGGDLEVVPAVRSRDEIGALAADFATMVGQLRASRAELQQLNEKLESEVARKTAQLVHAAKMGSVGTLAGGIAHEFNNLIGGIRGCAQEVLEETRDEDAREPLEVIVRAADRASVITDQLLRFSRQRVGRKAEVDLGSVLDDAIRLVEPAARRSRVSIARRIDTVPAVHADGAALHQVFVNLFTNAIHAMPDGGDLRVTSGAKGDVVAVEVADTGVGIPTADLERVFDPFFTSKDREQDPARRGSGLGLSVSYSIVEGHGGTIGVRSEVGVGTTFTVRIPGAGRAQEASEA